MTGAVPCKPPESRAVQIPSTAPTSQPTSAPIPSIAEVQQKTREYWDWATAFVMTHGPNILIVFVIIFVSWVLANWARRITRQGLEKAKFDVTLGKFLSNVVRWAILTLAVISCLDRFGIQTTSFAALIGVAGLAIGLSLQGSLAHLAAGVMLLIFRPFKVGDVIVVAGQNGLVNEIDLFTTSLDTPDGRRIILPNGSVFGSVIENSSHHKMRRLEMTIGVVIAANVEQTRKVLEAAARAAAGVNATPAPTITLTAMSAGAYTWNVQVWCELANLGATREALIGSLKDSLDKAGIALA